MIPASTGFQVDVEDSLGQGSVSLLRGRLARPFENTVLAGRIFDDEKRANDVQIQ